MGKEGHGEGEMTALRMGCQIMSFAQDTDYCSSHMTRGDEAGI